MATSWENVLALYFGDTQLEALYFGNDELWRRSAGDTTVTKTYISGSGSMLFTEVDNDAGMEFTFDNTTSELTISEDIDEEVS